MDDSSPESSRDTSAVADGPSAGLPDGADQPAGAASAAAGPDSAGPDPADPDPAGPDPAGPDGGGRRPGLAAVLAVIAIGVLAADQATKFLVVRDLTPDVPVTVIAGWLQLRLIRNPGAAFSLATGATWIFTIIATVVSVTIVRISRQLGSWWWAIALGLLLGGALGNLLDRLFRAPGFARGHVVDFIEYLRFPFMDFPVFNVADSCLVIASCLVAVLGVRGIGIDGRRTVD